MRKSKSGVSPDLSSNRSNDPTPAPDAIPADTTLIQKSGVSPDYELAKVLLRNEEIKIGRFARFVVKQIQHITCS